MSVNRQIILSEYPKGMPQPEHLPLKEGAMPSPKEGQVLIKTIYLSLDPYMRGRMSPAKSYAASVELGDVMQGGTVGQIVESRLEGYEAGDYVLGFGGWQEYSVQGKEMLRKLDPKQVPISTALGVLGLSLIHI